MSTDGTMDDTAGREEARDDTGGGASGEESVDDTGGGNGVPLFAFVGRLTQQKGFHLLCENIYIYIYMYVGIYVYMYI